MDLGNPGTREPGNREHGAGSYQLDGYMTAIYGPHLAWLYNAALKFVTPVCFSNTCITMIPVLF